VGFGFSADTTATYITPLYLFTTSSTRKSIDSSEVLIGLLPKWKLFSKQKATAKQMDALRDMKMECMHLVLQSLIEAERQSPEPAITMKLRGKPSSADNGEWKLHCFGHLFLADRPMAQANASVFDGGQKKKLSNHVEFVGCREKI